MTDPAVHPDGASMCPAGSCNYQSQDGCDASQACRPNFNATDPTVNPGCESFGSGVSHSACMAQGDCARGYYCVGQECHKLCCGNDWSACPDGESCFTDLSVRAGGQVIPSGAAVCFPVNACDALVTGGCATGRACKIVDARGSVACVPSGQAQAGDPCVASSACGMGLICVETDVAGAKVPICRKLCAAEMCGTPACTPEEGLCKHFTRDPEGVGECTPGVTG